LGSLEYYSKNKDKEEAELKVLLQKDQNYQKLAINERYQLFDEIEYYFPFPAEEEITSFGMELIIRAAKLGKYCLPENSTEAAEHILKILGLNFFNHLTPLPLIGEDLALAASIKSDNFISYTLSLFGSRVFHDNYFDAEDVGLMNKVDDKEGVYSAKVISFVAIIALCSYHLASALESSGEKTDPNKMALNASGEFLSFLEVEDKNKLITLGLEKAQNLYSSEPPNKWRDELFELTQKFCLSSSQEEDDKCFKAMFDIFNEILKTFKVKEKLNSEEESMYDGEI